MGYVERKVYWVACILFGEPIIKRFLTAQEAHDFYDTAPPDAHSFRFRTTWEDVGADTR